MKIILDKELPITLEIVEIYPFRNYKNRGTFHVYWCEMDIDLRGCRFEIRPTGPVTTFFPSARGFDEGKTVHYPIFNFTDKEYTRKWRKAMTKALEAHFKREKIQYQKPKEEKKETEN